MKADFGWPAVLRLGLVQAALGAVVVLTTSTLNRVMVVELPAGPRAGSLGRTALWFRCFVRAWATAPTRRRRTPWIVGGMALLAAGGVGAACATRPWASPLAGIVLRAVLSTDRRGRQRRRNLAAGVGGAAGRAVAAPPRQPSVWLMMIAGFAVTAGIAGSCSTPFACPAGRSERRGVARRLRAGLHRRVRPGDRAADRRVATPAPSVASGAAPASAFATRSRRPGPSRRRAASPSSCSSRCWPTAPRI